MTKVLRYLALLLGGLAPGWVEAAPDYSIYTYLQAGSYIDVYALSPTFSTPPHDPSFENDYDISPAGSVTRVGSIPNGFMSSTAQQGALKSRFTVGGQDQAWLRSIGGSLKDNPIIYNAGVTGTGSAAASDVIVPHRSGHFSTSYLFERDRQLHFILDRQLITDALAANVGNPNFYGSLYAGYFIESLLWVRLIDLDASFQDVASLFVTDDLNILSTINGPTDDLQDRTSEVHAQTTIDRYEGGQLVDHSEIPFVIDPNRPNPLDESSGPLTYTFAADYVAGHHYELRFDLGCSVNLTGVYAFSNGASATCDASHSAYYNGITAASDSNGHPIPVADVGIDSASGFDYRYASPLSPNPPAVGAVPEVAVWQLMLASLGSLWLLRHRSKNAIVRRRGHVPLTVAG